MTEPNEFDVSHDGCNLGFVAADENTAKFSVGPTVALLNAVTNAQNALNAVAEILGLPHRHQPGSSPAELSPQEDSTRWKALDDHQP